MDFLLHSTRLSFAFPGGPSFQFPDVSVNRQEELLLLGQSGTGKTTLLHLLSGLRSATEGSIKLAGHELVGASKTTLDRWRGEHVGIVYQTAHFVPSLSVLDNLTLPQYLNGIRPDRARARALLERLNLSDKVGQKPGSLSVGEQQRVGIVRALMNAPDVVFADEPTSALDDRNAGEVMDLLREQVLETGAALIVVTHDQRLKDRIAKTVAL